VEYRTDGWLLTAGKFPNPLARMDLVWDGDRNPYGVAAGVRLGDDRQTDAVLTAFSHDNINYASNNRQHTLSIDYSPLEKTLLNLTTYIYRRDEYQPDYAPGWDEYVSRTRLNLVYVF